MEDKQFEQKVSLEMDSFKLKPSEAVWQNVEAQLKEDKKRRRWVLLLLFAGLLVGGGAAVYLTSGNSNTTTVTQQSTSKTSDTEVQQQVPANSNIESNNQPSVINKTADSTVVVAEKNINEVVAKQPSTKPVQSVLTTQVKAKRSSLSQSSALLKTKDNKQTNGLVNNNEPVVVIETKTQTQTATADTTAGTQTKNEEIKTVIFTEETTATTTANNDSAVVKTSSTTTVDTAVIKKKWQLGFQLNAGIAQIRETILPGGMYATADASPLYGNNGAPGGATRITVNQFAIKPSLQFGAGLVLRHTIFKKHSFVTGLQYQYSCYIVLQKQRVDSFVQTTSSFSTVMNSESRARFTTHSIAVPLDVEWKIASTAKGMFRLGTGLQQWFSIASAQQGNPSSFRYSNTANNTVQQVRWQPVLELAPAYEWGVKKQTSQLGLYFNYGLRPVYRTAANAKDYWWQTGLRYRFYFAK